MYRFQFTAEVLFSSLVVGDEYPAEVFPALVSDVIVHLHDDAVLALGQPYRVFDIINLVAVDVELDFPYTRFAILSPVASSVIGQFSGFERYVGLITLRIGVLGAVRKHISDCVHLYARLR